MYDNDIVRCIQFIDFKNKEAIVYFTGIARIYLNAIDLYFKTGIIHMIYPLCYNV
jgi:hypothetical protein